jgi:RND family efflux transporter MFP subunit
VKIKHILRKLWLVPLIGVLAIGVYKIAATQGTEVLSEEVHVHTVSAAAVSKTTKEDKLLLTGDITAYDIAVVSSKIAGRVSRVLVKNGAYVTVGQPLVVLDDGEYNRAVEMSEVQLGKAEIALADVSTNLERVQFLFESGAIPRKDYDDVVTAVQMAEADVALAEVAVAQAAEQLEHVTIRAKLQGVVTRRGVTVGQVLAPGMPLMEIHKITPIYVVVDVPQSELAHIKQGQQVQLTVDTYPDRQFTGTVEVLEQVGNPGARTFTAKIRIENQEQLLKPGMFAMVNLKLGEVEVLAVPQQSFITKEDRYFVFVAEDGHVRHRQVEIGQVIGQLVEIKSGLTEGEKVITTNVNKLKDGDKIIIQGDF